MVIHSAIYVALGTLLIVALAFRVSLHRKKYQVGIGAGNQLQLDLAIRSHGNAVENLPLALLLLSIAESIGLPLWAVHSSGIVLIVSRVLHAWGLSTSQGTSTGRFVGILLCWFVMVVLAFYVLYVGFIA